MIIKFDHIAFSCSNDANKGEIKNVDGYKTVFREEGIDNHIIKKELMDFFPKDHSIELMEKNGCIPIEITMYDNVCRGSSKYLLSESIPLRIIVNTENVDESKAFYKRIGFAETDEGILKMSYAIGESPIELSFFKKEIPSKNRLDAEGFCCLAFVTNNAKKEKSRLERDGVLTTDIGVVNLNGKTMEVFFISNKYGDICEFIQICKNVTTEEEK